MSAIPPVVPAAVPAISDAVFALTLALLLLAPMAIAGVAPFVLPRVEPAPTRRITKYARRRANPDLEAIMPISPAPKRNQGV